MLVFRDEKQTLDTARCLAGLQSGVRALRGHVDHDSAVHLLVDFGELESGVADALCPTVDDHLDSLQAWRAAALALGRLVDVSWSSNPGDVPAALDEAACALAQLAPLQCPPQVAAKPPEGYTHYGLYPAMYLEAALRFLGEAGPRPLVVLGLRSIGTSLSAVVGAALRARGCPTLSYSLRPKGPPFDRRPSLGAGLRRRLQASTHAHFLIVDEGPGLSGSSLCGTAQVLSDLGVADERIVFFPSREIDASHLRSEVARQRWASHRHWIASFEQVWIDSGRLAGPQPATNLMDLAQGRWRPLVCSSEAHYPPVHPHHERRKYLCWNLSEIAGSLGSGLTATPAPPGARPTLHLAKFAGLGRHGAAKLARAQQLAEAGFAPPVAGLACGFLITRFVPGRAVTPADVDAALLDRLAQYLAHTRAKFAGSRPADFDSLLEMVQVNVVKGLGEAWLPPLTQLERFRPAVQDHPAVALDARMLPHEWLHTAAGYIKTDGVDHHSDHFYPGAQDIAWDIAGTEIEFGLNAEALQFLLNRYQARRRDPALWVRLPFYRLAYLAYRLGYTHLAAETLVHSPDGANFCALSQHYAEQLRQALELLAEPEHMALPMRLIQDSPIGQTQT